MELRVLNYFLMVAREENITRAAQMLHLTQPTLSRQLMQLEEELGVKLFERSSRSITLTSEGMLLKRRAQEMMSLAEKTREELAQREENLAGRITIGSGELQSVNELAELIVGFRRRYPLVTFDIYSANTVAIKERLENGTVDIGILLEPVDTAKYEFIRLQTREQWVALVREDSPLADKESITPADLIAYPLLVPSNYAVQNELLNWFGDYATEINIASTHNLLYNAAIMVQKGAGVSLCMKIDCHYDDLKFIPLSPKRELGSVVVWKERQVFPPATEAFIGYLKQCLKSIE